MTQVQADPRLTPLEQVVASALQHLEERGFSARTRRYYERAWDLLVRFAHKSAPLCTRVRELEGDFLISCGISPGRKRCDLTWSQDMTRRGLRILIEFQETGRFHCHEKNAKKPCIPPLLRQEQERYEAFCRDHLRHRATTVATARVTDLSGLPRSARHHRTR